MSDAEKIVRAINELQKTVARLAWAIESNAMSSPGQYDSDHPCPNCGSRLVLAVVSHCMACGEEKRDG